MRTASSQLKLDTDQAGCTHYLTSNWRCTFMTAFANVRVTHLLLVNTHRCTSQEWMFSLWTNDRCLLQGLHVYPLRITCIHVSSPHLNASRETFTRESSFLICCEPFCAPAKGLASRALFLGFFTHLVEYQLYASLLVSPLGIGEEFTKSCHFKFGLLEVRFC